MLRYLGNSLEGSSWGRLGLSRTWSLPIPLGGSPNVSGTWVGSRAHVGSTSTCAWLACSITATRKCTRPRTCVPRTKTKGSTSQISPIGLGSSYSRSCVKRGIYASHGRTFGICIPGTWDRKDWA